jgi:hypothetical protein
MFHPILSIVANWKRLLIYNENFLLLWHFDITVLYLFERYILSLLAHYLVYSWIWLLECRAQALLEA